MKTSQYSYISSSVEGTRTNSKSSNTNAKLTPLDFDNFVPWLCLQFQVPIIVDVKRFKQEKYISHSSKRISIRTNSKQSNIQSKTDVTSSSSNSSLSVLTSFIDDIISIKTFYNSKGKLVEVAIINCPFEINRKIIKVINLCLPFHTSLYSFKIIRSGLTHAVLYEMSKLLPHSNITDICLDDNYVPEGNYYLLLEKLSSIRNLSLKRCKINDEACKRIAAKLGFDCPASKTLLILELASNCITDIGAKYLGLMIRQNRSLLYLNISDNKITDAGLNDILIHLTLFPLTIEEKIAKNHKYFKYITDRVEIYNKCKDAIINQLIDEEEKENQIDSKRLAILEREKNIDKRPSVHFDDDPAINQQAEEITIKLVGEFKNMFDCQNIICDNGKIYDIGNLKITYLNIAYNNLGYFSVRKIYDILKYQSKISKPDDCKGLLKIVLDGNNIPKECKELNGIGSLLNSAITNNIPRKIRPLIKTVKRVT